MYLYKKIILIILFVVINISSYASECIVNPTITSRIASGPRWDGVLINPKKSVAVRSTSFKKLYFIAALMTMKDFKEPSIGVWTSNGLENGMIFSINSAATGFTVFPDGQKAGPKININDHGYKEVLACFKINYK